MRKPITLSRGAAAAIVLAVLCGGCSIVQNVHWSTARNLTCDDVPADLIDTVVPGADSYVLPASFNGPGIHCEWYSDTENGRSAVLVLEIRQYEDRILRPGAREASRDYGFGKENMLRPTFTLGVADLPGLCDDAYAYPQPGENKDDGEVGVGCLEGATVIEVSYTAAPSTESLRLAGAAAVVSALLKELR